MPEGPQRKTHLENYPKEPVCSNPQPKTVNAAPCTSFNANCPQAAITSRPREYRTNAGTPFSTKIRRNSSIVSAFDSLYGSSPGFHGIKLTFTRVSGASNRTTLRASSAASFTPPNITYSNVKCSQFRSG